MNIIKAPGISVNGIKITPEQINFEVQYHPSRSLFSAKYEAMQALVVRELLIQRAVDLNLCNYDKALENPDEIIDKLLDMEIDVPIADEKACKHFYKNNKKKFFTPPLFEAAHILFLASPSDDIAREKALERAVKALDLINKNPDDFKKIAKNQSACSSAKTGGYLGQITKGQTTPEFESALFDMQEGEISPTPIASKYGYHIIKVHKRIEGKQLPFDAVEEWIADHLKSQSWQRAFSQYVQLLAGKAEISGFLVKQSDTPLVQ